MFNFFKRNSEDSKSSDLYHVLVSQVSWGYKTAWYAIKAPANPQDVAEIIGIKNLQETSWPAGVAAIYASGKKNAVFISEAVDGWMFVVGIPLASYANEKLIAVFEENLSVLSMKYGEAQFFATHRVVDLHIWARALEGIVVRSYYYVGESGEVYRNIGEPTAAEKGFSFLSQPMEEWQSFPNEENVLEVASSWSINPGSFENQKSFLESKKGYLGTLQ